MIDCDDCERLPLNDYPLKDIINGLDMWSELLNEDHIIVLEEITREWRDNHG